MRNILLELGFIFAGMAIGTVGVATYIGKFKNEFKVESYPKAKEAKTEIRNYEYDAIESIRKSCGNSHGSVFNIQVSENSGFQKKDAVAFLRAIADDIETKGWSARREWSRYAIQGLHPQGTQTWCAVFAGGDGLPAQPFTNDEIRQLREGK